MCSKFFPENIVTNKSEAESVLSNCVKYGRFQPKRAYKKRCSRRNYIQFCRGQKVERYFAFVTFMKNKDLASFFLKTKEQNGKYIYISL